MIQQHIVNNLAIVAQNPGLQTNAYMLQQMKSLKRNGASISQVRQYMDGFRRIQGRLDLRTLLEKADEV